MREIELLDALKLGPGGIRVDISEKGFTVTTKYVPYVKGTGMTLFNAVFDAAKEVVIWCQDHPTRHNCEKILEALRAYDAHRSFVATMDGDS